MKEDSGDFNTLEPRVRFMDENKPKLFRSFSWKFSKFCRNTEDCFNEIFSKLYIEFTTSQKPFAWDMWEYSHKYGYINKSFYNHGYKLFEDCVACQCKNPELSGNYEENTFVPPYTSSEDPEKAYEVKEEWNNIKARVTNDVGQLMDYKRDGLSDSEISEKLGLTSATVRKRWERAKKMIRYLGEQLRY